MPNGLQEERSLYLRQHRDNPVDWHPWGESAIELAQKEGRPIFLSIGYSACHWCHVMARESFADLEVAKLLNAHFVSIKVDREEYPDVDACYQRACQLFTGGGWPLSAFLLPDLRPFFVATYFPKADFLGLLGQISARSLGELEQNAVELAQQLNRPASPGQEISFPGHFPHPAAIVESLDGFRDRDNGGYGQAPKFPHFPFYRWALEQALDGMISREQLDHVVTTLTRMLMGGMFDHARGGIHRYSVDAKFLVPHFEKMLYDQAGLLAVLAKLSRLHPSPLVGDALADTLDYLKTQMWASGGHFFSSQDADSEGREGLYFTFSSGEFDQLVEAAGLAPERSRIRKWFAITEGGNFEDGLSVVSLDHRHAKEFLAGENWELVRRIRREILAARQGRVPPATDTKGIASWNFMLLSSLADCVQYAPFDSVRRTALELFNNSFGPIMETFWPSGKSIRHSTTCPGGQAYLEDYVAAAEAQLRAWEISARPPLKSRFAKTLKLILDQFVRGEEVFLRADLGACLEHNCPNLTLDGFDSSFASPLSTLVELVRRGGLLLGEQRMGEKIAPVIARLKQFALRSPVGAGQALRACTYPDAAYRVLQVPRTWRASPEFARLMALLLPRFVLDYHEEKKESWQVCGPDSCQLAGEGLADCARQLGIKDGGR